MKKTTKRPQEILNAARRATAKITDPVTRAKAAAKLDVAQKKLDANQLRTVRPSRQQRRVHKRNIDLDR